MFPHGRAHLSSGPLCVLHGRASFKWPVVCVIVLFPHGRAHLSSGPFCVLLRCMVVLIFQVARSVCYCVVPTWSYSSFKWPIMCATVLFPHGRVHLSSGPLCVLLCCSYMVVLIFQVARYVCYCAAPTWSCHLSSDRKAHVHERRHVARASCQTLV